MGDRWKPAALADSHDIWLPFEMKESGTMLEGGFVETVNGDFI
jgi:hypothetical protein